ncbi:hypothetical protein Tco_0421662 [Tanacetum coccineum]
MSNLEYLRTDHHWPTIPRFAKIANEWYYSCQDTVRNSVCLYAGLIGPEVTNNVLNDFYRSHTNEEESERFFLKYDVEPFDIIKDEFYYSDLNIITDWFISTHLIHPVHFTDLGYYPWKISTSAERPITHMQDLQNTVQQIKRDGVIDNARMSFSNCYDQVFAYSSRYIHKIKDDQTIKMHHIDLHVKPVLVWKNEPPKIRTVFGVPNFFTQKNRA